MLLFGIYLFIISIITILIYSLIEYNDLYLIKNIFDFAENNLFFFFAFIIGTIVKFLFCFIIYYFSPNLFILTNITGNMIILIHNLFAEKNKETKYLIFKGVGYFIILFSTLIYNEIVILNFCDLNVNTKKVIKERGKEEESLLNEEMKENNNNSIEVDGYFYNVNEDNDSYIYTNKITKNINSK